MSSTDAATPLAEPEPTHFNVYIRVTGPDEDRNQLLAELEDVALEDFFAVHSPLPEGTALDPEDYWDAAAVSAVKLDPRPGAGPHIELTAYPNPPFAWLDDVSVRFPNLTFTAVYDEPYAQDGEARFGFKAGEPLEEWWF